MAHVGPPMIQFVSLEKGKVREEPISFMPILEKLVRGLPKHTEIVALIQISMRQILYR